MIVLSSIVIVSFVIGRINLIENIVFKSYGDGRHYDPLNMSIFILLGFIKLIIALLVASRILPSQEVMNASLSLEKDPALWQMSQVIYQSTFRTTLVSLCVVIADFIGIWKVKH